MNSNPSCPENSGPIFRQVSNDPRDLIISCSCSDEVNQSGILGSYDVICGRHKEAFRNVGNRRFRVTVSVFLDRYRNAASKQDKSKIVMAIVDLVHANGGRFLRLEKGGTLCELSLKEAKEKTGHALRDMNQARDAGSCNQAMPKLLKSETESSSSMTFFKDITDQKKYLQRRGYIGSRSDRTAQQHRALCWPRDDTGPTTSFHAPCSESMVTYPKVPRVAVPSECFLRNVLGLTSIEIESLFRSEKNSTSLLQDENFAKFQDLFDQNLVIDDISISSVA